MKICLGEIIPDIPNPSRPAALVKEGVSGVAQLGPKISSENTAVSDFPKRPKMKFGKDTCFQCLQCKRLFPHPSSMYSHWNNEHIEFGKLYRKSAEWFERVKEIDRETFERLTNVSSRDILLSKSELPDENFEEMPKLAAISVPENLKREPDTAHEQVSAILLCCEFCQETFSSEQVLEEHLSKSHKTASDGILIESIERNDL